MNYAFIRSALKLLYLVTVFQFRERHTATSHPLSIGLWCLTVQARTSRFAAVYLDSIAGAAQVGVDPRKWQVREEALNSEKRRGPPQGQVRGYCAQVVEALDWKVSLASYPGRFSDKWPGYEARRPQVLATEICLPFKVHFVSPRESRFISMGC